MEPKWKPLIAKLGERRCVGFMFMGRVNGINLYKHGIARLYLNLDDQGRCYSYQEPARFEPADFDEQLARIEKLLAQLDETLYSVYDSAYVERKTRALREASIEVEHINVCSEHSFVN